MQGIITDTKSRLDRKGRTFYHGISADDKSNGMIVYSNKLLHHACSNSNGSKVIFEADKFYSVKGTGKFINKETIFCYNVKNVSASMPETKPETKPEIKTIVVPLSLCKFYDYCIKIPMGHKDIYVYEWNLKYEDNIFKPKDFPFSKLLDRIKKIFQGNITIEYKIETSNLNYYSRTKVTSIVVDDAETEKIKKFLINYKVNLEYKKLIREAKRIKQFYNRQQLKQKLKFIDPNITDDDIEKRFNRDKYDYKCYATLKENTKAEDVYLGIDAFIFILRDMRTNIDWYLMETPGKSAATYIFNNRLSTNELIGKLAITPRSCIIADKKIQEDLGFLGRVVHRSFPQWRKQLESVLKYKLLVSFMNIEDAVKKVEKIKENYKKSK